MSSTTHVVAASLTQDFSEDTYRTLAAADNAVMLVDAAKGLEPQTRKLFEVRNKQGVVCPNLGVVCFDVWCARVFDRVEQGHDAYTVAFGFG